jgi:hypothetical protein
MLYGLSAERSNGRDYDPDTSIHVEHVSPNMSTRAIRLNYLCESRANESLPHFVGFAPEALGTLRQQLYSVAEKLSSKLE